eukprot:PITA_16230
MKLFFLSGSLFLFLALFTSAVDVRQMSIDEYINFVNPPAVYKYQNKFGESILCVKFSDQISVKYARDNFTRGLEKPPKPKSSPLIIPNIDSAHVNTSELFLKDECPEDTVALREIKREQVERAGSVSKFLNRGRGRRYNVVPNVDPSRDGYVHQHAIVRFDSRHRPFTKLSADMNVWRPKVSSDAQFSLSQIWIGYVALSGLPRPGSTVLPISESGGTQVELEISIEKQVIQGRGDAWALYYAGQRIGYWPASLFGAQSLGSAAVDFDIGGEISYSPRPAGSAYTKTDMGSGEFPSSGFGYAAYTKRIEIYDSGGHLIEDPDFEERQFKPDCYQVTYGEYTGAEWGKTVFYGGPGGYASDCVA